MSGDWASLEQSYLQVSGCTRRPRRFEGGPPVQHPAVIEHNSFTLLQSEADFEPIRLIFNKVGELLSPRVRSC